jgi:integrase/recombinase XerD
MSICNRNRIMTGLRFLFRVTLRRLDLAAEIYHIREPQKIPLVMSPDETRRLLAVADILKVRTLLSLGYGCGLRASEVVRLKVKHIAPRRRSFGSSSPRAARIVMSCCRPRCSTCCANGGRRAHRVTTPGRKPGKPMTTRQLNRLFHGATDDRPMPVTSASVS